MTTLMTNEAIGARTSINDFRHKLQSTTTIQIQPLDISVEERTSIKNNPYEAVTVDYVIVGLSKPKHFSTAVFSSSGRLIVSKMDVGKTYNITTKTNDRGYDEWIDLEEIVLEESALKTTPSIMSGFDAFE